MSPSWGEGRERGSTLGGWASFGAAHTLTSRQVFIADTDNHRVEVFSVGGLRHLRSLGGVGVTALREPYGLVLAQGRLFVAEMTRRLHVLDPLHGVAIPSVPGRMGPALSPRVWPHPFQHPAPTPGPSASCPSRCHLDVISTSAASDSNDSKRIAWRCRGLSSTRCAARGRDPLRPVCGCSPHLRGWL